MYQLGRFSATGFNQLKTHKAESVGHVFRSEEKFVENEIPQADVEQAKADNYQTHDRAGTESNLQTGIQTGAACLSRTAGGVGRGTHTDITAETGEETACEERYRNKRILDAEIGENRKDHKEDYKYNEYHFVLTFEVSHCAFAHESGDFLHFCRAGIRFHHLLIEDKSGQKCQDTGDRGDPPQQFDVGCSGSLSYDRFGRNSVDRFLRESAG